MDNSTAQSLNDTPTNALNSTPVNLFTQYSQQQILEIVAPQIIVIDRTISPIWYVLGLVGNPISAKIWLSRKIRKTNSSALYFGSLAIVQTFYLFLHIIVELESAWGVNTYHRKFLCEFINFIFITPQYLVPMLVLGFTTERYIAVCHPFVKEKYCTVRNAQIVILIMGTCSVCIGAVQLYIWAWNDFLGCVFRENTESFNTVWTWITEMLIFGVVPLACLVINVLVVLEIQRITVQSAAHGQTQTSNAASTTTLLSVSFYFICTLLPATIVYAMQTSVPQGHPDLPLKAWKSDPVWNSYFSYLTVRKIVEEICLSNYAAYFIIYYATGVYFRREFWSMFCLKKLRKLVGKGDKKQHSEYSLVNSNGKTMTETMFTDSPSNHSL